MLISLTFQKICYLILSHICKGPLKENFKKKYENLQFFQNKAFNESYFVIGDSHTDIFHRNKMDQKMIITGR